MLDQFEQVVKKNPSNLRHLRLMAGAFSVGGMARDLVRARDYAKQAAECVDSEVDDWLLYSGLTAPYFGVGSPERASADSFLHRAAAAGHARAQCAHGLCLVDAARLGQPELFAPALDWLTKAMAQGDAKATFNIACHFYGPLRVVPGPGDVLQYETLLRKAADLGEIQAMAVLSSILLERGSAVSDEEMRKEGMQLQRCAADGGHANSIWNEFVTCHLNGDSERASSYLDRAVGLGISRALDYKSCLLKDLSKKERAAGRTREAKRLSEESAALAAAAIRSSAREKKGMCSCGRDHAQDQHLDREL